MVKDLKQKETFAIVIGDISMYGNTLRSVKDNKIPGRIVHGSELSTFYVPGSNFTIISFKETAPFLNLKYHIVDKKDIELISEDKVSEISINVEKYKKYLQDKKDEFINSYETISTVGYKDRKFYLSLFTNIVNAYNYASIGKWNTEYNSFNEQVTNYIQTCCAFTKTTSDLKIYIPEIYLNLFRYTREDFKLWLEFISKCDIGFVYKDLGPISLSKEYDKHTAGLTQNLNVNYSNAEDSIKTIYLNKNEGYHGLLMKGCSSVMLTYLNFICLRYFYNASYWNIPGLAMQIKDQLGDTVTHWEALLLAHLNHDYDPYYSLCINSRANSSFADPFQKKEDIIEKLKSNKSSMNNCFIYKKYDPAIIDDFFKNSDFVNLCSYIKECNKN